MASMKDNSTVEKLIANNYLNWRFKVEILLIREQLIEVITDNAPTSVTTDWTNKDRNQVL